MEKRVGLIQITIIVSCLICFLVSIIHYENYMVGYRGMVIFPLLYLFITVPFIKRLLCGSFSITSAMYLFIQWIRFVLMPVVIALAGEKCGTPYIYVNKNTLSLSVVLMAAELIVCTFFIVYQSSKQVEIKRKSPPKMTGEPLVYICFLILAIGVYFIFSKRGNLFDFLIIESGTNRRIGDINDTLMVLARQVILVAIMVIFVSVLSYGAKRYEKSPKKLYFYIPLFVALLSVCIIVGERRTSQIYTAFCCIYCLTLAFPKEKKMIYRVIGGVAVLVLIFMSMYKMFYAFNYNSYLDAIANSSFSYSELARTLQGYFSGPQNIAVAIEFGKREGINFLNFIYDIVRSTPPFSFFVENIGVITSIRFNTYIYGASTSSGHLLSTTGYGYICFGPLFYYLVMMLNIKLSLICEKNMKRATSFEFIYVWGYLLMRFSFGVNINTPALLNSSAIILMTAGLLFKVSQIVKYNNRIF